MAETRYPRSDYQGYSRGRPGGPEGYKGGLLVVTDRALEEHDHDAAEWLIDLLLQAEESADIDEAAIARAAVIDAPLAVARDQQRGQPDQ
jgi:hypothetical protein